MKKIVSVFLASALAVSALDSKVADKTTTIVKISVIVFTKYFIYILLVFSELTNKHLLTTKSQYNNGNS